MDRKNILNTPKLLEIRKKKRALFLRKIYIGIGIFIFFFIGLAFLSNLKNIRISEINIYGNKIIDANLIKAEVEKEIAGKYLWVFPKNNSFLYGEKKIKNTLNTKWPRFRDVSLNVNNFKTLEIRVIERDGKYTWCGESIPETGNEINQKCYFIDEKGFVFDEAPYFSGEVYFKFFGKMPNSEMFFKLVSFKEYISDLKLKPVALYIKEDGDIEFYLSSNLNYQDAPKIIFKQSSDFDKILENLQSAISTEPLKSNLENKNYTLKYIDLSFGNKVYYAPE